MINSQNITLISAPTRFLLHNFKRSNIVFQSREYLRHSHNFLIKLNLSIPIQQSNDRMIAYINPLAPEFPFEF